VVLAGWDTSHGKPESLPVPYGFKPMAMACAIRDTSDVSLLTGPKRLAFFANLMGDESHVTLDVWALKPFGITTGTPGVKARIEITRCYVQLAESLNITPAAAQAAVWCHLRKEVW
jgi:hypothetical protein